MHSTEECGDRLVLKRIFMRIMGGKEKKKQLVGTHTLSHKLKFRV